MRTFGFIGYGRMNQMLIEGFIEAGVLKEAQIIVSNRTIEKFADISDKYPGIRHTAINHELIEVADVIIIGVRPLDVPTIVQEINSVRNDAHIVSIAACVRIGQMASMYPGPVSRVLPSICSTVGEGITLVCHHEQVKPENIEEITELFSSISTVIELEEELFEPAGDLTSCGPALLAQMFLELAKAGARHSSLSVETCLEMVISTSFGTALMLQEGLHPSELIGKVATPGGITEEGVKILQADLPQVCDRIFTTTLEKYDRLRDMVEKSVSTEHLPKAERKF